MKYVSKLPLAVALALIGIAGFGVVAYAADTATPADSQSILDLLKPVYDAFAGGHYAFAAALLTIALVALAKRYLGDKLPWLHSDAGGTCTALLMAGAGALATGLAAPGATVTLALMKSAFLVGIGAAGGYAALKNLLVDPILKPLAAKAPAWAQPLFAVLFFFFDKPDAAAAATKAGDAAVAAKPAAGVVGVTGAPTDVK